jgi:signal recognition particle subunit SRP54
MGKLSSADLEKGETQLKRTEAMINSMTKEEKTNPQLLAQSPSRRRRVAKGSGYEENDVAKLVKDFTKMRSLMQQMTRGGMPSMPAMPGMGGMGGMPGMGGMGNPFGGGGAQMPGFRGYQGGSKKKKKKDKKKKGFGSV